MKKIIITLGLILTTLALGAQNRISYSAEFAVGVGIGKGPLATLTPQFIAQFDLGNGFRVGGGIGLRYAMPCDLYTFKQGDYSRRFSNEFDIPAFLRFGYEKGDFYANLDAGYAIGVIAFDGLDTVPGGLKENDYNGLFIEPQIGWKIGERRALAVGLLWQQSSVMNHIYSETGEFGTPSYSISQIGIRESILTPAITLRYAVDF